MSSASSTPNQFRRNPILPPLAPRRQQATSRPVQVRPILVNQPDFRNDHALEQMPRLTRDNRVQVFCDQHSIRTANGTNDSDSVSAIESMRDDVSESDFVRYQRDLVMLKLNEKRDELDDTLDVISCELMNVYRARQRIIAMEYNVWMLNVQLGEVEVDDFPGLVAHEE